MAGELQEWELLHDSDSDSVGSHPSDGKSINFDEIESESKGILRSDYFSINNLTKDVGEVGESVVSSNHPSLVYPRLENLSGNQVLSCLSSDRLGESRSGDDFGVKDDFGFRGRQEGCERVGELESESANVGEITSGERKLRTFDVGMTVKVGTEMGFENLCETQARDEDSGGDGLVSSESEVKETEREMLLADNMKKDNELGILHQSDTATGSGELIEGSGRNSSGDGVAAIASDEKSGGEGRRRSLAWWKMPFELIKYCVFKVSPVWSVSMAAAVMGIVLLGRRLYIMKRKAQSLRLKVTIDDKKASQVMSRAARLNEAFSVVRRVPVIRPALSAPGANPWPALSLR